MHEEFAPDFLSEDFLSSGVPEEDEEGDEAEVETEDEEETAGIADTEEEMLKEKLPQKREFFI